MPSGNIVFPVFLSFLCIVSMVISIHQICSSLEDSNYEMMLAFHRQYLLRNYSIPTQVLNDVRAVGNKSQSVLSVSIITSWMIRTNISAFMS